MQTVTLPISRMVPCFLSTKKSAFHFVFQKNCFQKSEKVSAPELMRNAGHNASAFVCV